MTRVISSTLRSSLVALSLGALAGGVSTWMLNAAASAQTCPNESWVGDNTQNVKHDDGDGVFEINSWAARGAADTLRSLACDDFMVEGEGENDDVGGGSGADWVLGNGEHDTVYGGAQNDQIYGGAGPDDMFDAETFDTDTAFGEDGNDTIDLRDGDESDRADGGVGTDTCLTNTNDIEQNCEA